MVLLNTSFFFHPRVDARLRHFLRTHWVPACLSCGAGAPTVLRMDSEEGIERLAVQTPFASHSEASRFLSEVLSPLSASLSASLGPEAFTCFSTLMDIIDL